MPSQLGATDVLGMYDLPSENGPTGIEWLEIPSRAEQEGIRFDGKAEAFL